MAKGSSAKKVARAARAGGGRVKGAGQRNLLFPVIISTIVILGVVLIAVARADYRAEDEIPPLLSDHWHAAFGIYVCGEFESNLPEFASQIGVHTHGDGVIHIHPHSANGAGENSTIGAFLEQTAVEVTDDSLVLGERVFENGDDCDGKPGRIVLAKWDRAQDPEEEPELITEDILDTRFRKDAEAYTLAFLPEGTEIPKPETATSLDELGAVDSGAVPPTSAPTSESTTATSESATTTDSATSSTTASSTTSP